MPAPILRDYQARMVEQIRARFRERRRRVLAVAPTGSGKTVVFSYIAHHAVERGHRVLILVHRAELLDQVSTALRAFGTPHGIVCAGYPPDAGQPVQVASVFSLLRRNIEPPTLVIVDEAHHAVASTTWGKVLSRYPHARILGVTATPLRLSGEGLGECFDVMVQGPTVSELLGGALSPFRVFAPPTIDTAGMHTRMGEFVRAEVAARTDNATVTGSALDHYRKHVPGKSAMVFCVSVAHAEHVAAQFTAAGISAKSIDGTLDRGLRREIVQAFSNGQLRVLTSCDLVSEGFDCPRIEVGISLRPTQSLGLWLQQVGRCLRPFPGKEEAIIFDHAGNTVRHGLPDDEREWSLEGDAGGERQAREGGMAVRVCPKCFAANRGGAPVCAECGEPFVVKGRQVEEVEGELVEINPALLKMQRRQEVWRARTFSELVALGTSRHYRAPTLWAKRILEWRAEKRARSHPLAAL